MNTSKSNHKLRKTVSIKKMIENHDISLYTKPLAFIAKGLELPIKGKVDKNGYCFTANDCITILEALERK